MSDEQFRSLVREFRIIQIGIAIMIVNLVSSLGGCNHESQRQGRDIRARDHGAHPPPWRDAAAGLLRVSLVQSQRNAQCRLVARRYNPADARSADGLHGVRADRGRRAARLESAHEQVDGRRSAPTWLELLMAAAERGARSTRRHRVAD
jgi:hypothetical protein